MGYGYVHIKALTAKEKFGCTSYNYTIYHCIYFAPETQYNLDIISFRNGHRHGRSNLNGSAEASTISQITQELT